MKLLHSGARARALVSASRGLRSYEGSRYTYAQLSRPSQSTQLSPTQWHLRRTVTTKPAPSSSSPPSSTTNHSNTPANDTLSESIRLSTQIRLLMRRVPYPVAIITSTDPTPTPSQSQSPSHTDQAFPTRYRGMTVSSFNTVTLTPEPVISFNVRRPSETLHALLSSGRFLVHLLATDKSAADLARDFAMGNHRIADGDGSGMSGFQFVGVSPFDEGAVEHTPGPGEGETEPLPLPMLRRKNSTSDAKQESETSFSPFIFECRLLPDSIAEVYDHTIVVGRVVRAITSGDAGSEISSKDLCLTYANTKFLKIGDEVV
ncbi:flavin reductase like domain-containing protein [Aspergillus venezuelensis]